MFHILHYFAAGSLGVWFFLPQRHRNDWIPAVAQRLPNVFRCFDAAFDGPETSALGTDSDAGGGKNFAAGRPTSE
jgi:hypothetical protein